MQPDTPINGVIFNDVSVLISGLEDPIAMRTYHWLDHFTGLSTGDECVWVVGLPI